MIKRSRVISLVLALMMVVSCFNFVFAVQYPQKTAENVKNVDMNEKISVIIELVEKPLLDYSQAITLGAKSFLETDTARDVKESIITTQEAVQEKILDTVDVNATFKYAYTNTLNGFAAEIMRSDIAKIKAIPGVKNIYIDKIYDLPTPQMSSSTGMVNAPNVWNIEHLKGEGTVVAVIDTGVDVDHELMLVSDKTRVKLEFDSLDDVISKLNAKKLMPELTVDDVFANRKFPYCFDYADSDNNANADSNDHGVHVSGTVAANGTLASTLNNNLHTNIIFNGIAPEAQIIGMKVFSSKGGGAKTSDTLAAVEDAITLGADAMNLSLGSAAGFTFYEGDELAQYEYEYSFRKARDAGIMVVCSAGNNNKIGEESFLALAYGYVNPTTANVDSGLVGSPSTKNHALSVASIENKSIVANYILGPNDLRVMFSDTSGTYTPSKVSFTDVLDGGTYEYVDCGIGQPSNFEGKDLQDKIALIQRGTLSFFEKVNNAAVVGAKGVIIYNSPGNAGILNMNLTGITTDVPAVAITRADGLALLAAEQKQITVDSSFEGLFDNNLAYQMSDFTSWGCTPDLKLKPEITAPGGQIYSTLPNNEYGIMSGTSMASPHVAGASAIMQQYVNSDSKFADMTNEEKADIIEALLMSTAGVAIDPSGLEYSPRRQGAGLMDLEAAVNSNVYLMNSESGKAKIELSEVGDSFYIEFDIVNLSSRTYSYELTSSLFTEDFKYLKALSITLPSSINFEESEIMFGDIRTNPIGQTTASAITGMPIVVVEPNSTKHVELTVNMNEDEVAFINKYFPNGFFVEGFIQLLSLVGEQPDLSIPYMGFYGDWTEAPTVDGSYYYDDLLSDFYYTNSYAYDFAYDENGEPYAYYRLGHNGIYDPTAKDYTLYNYNWIAFSPNGDGYLDGMGYRTNFLRNVKNLVVDVYDSNNKLVKNMLDSVYYDKTYYSSNQDALTTEDLPLWNGKNDNGDLVEDGQYYYVISTLLDYPGAELESKKIPVFLDTEAPVLVDVTYEGNETTITLKDNGYISYVSVEDIVANAVTQYSPKTPVKDYKFTVPMGNLSGKYIELYVEDCAGNVYEIKVVGNPNGLEKPLVVFQLDGGSINNSTENIELELDENNFVKKPSDPVKEGYNFVGWYDISTNELFDFTKPVTRLTVLSAKYEVKVYYDVTFKLNGGSINDSTNDIVVNLAKNTCLQKPADPQKPGFNFVGWFEKDATTAFDFTKPITKAVTLTAKYAAIVVDPGTSTGGTTGGSTVSPTVTVNPTVPSSMIGVKLDNKKAVISIDKKAADLIKDGKSNILSIFVDKVKDADDISIVIPTEIMQILAKYNMTIELNYGNMVKFIIKVTESGELVIELKSVEGINAGSDYNATAINYDINIKQNGRAIDNTGNVVKVEFSAKGIKDLSKAGVYTLDSNENIEYVMTYLNGDVLSFYPPHFSPFSVMVCNKTFKDIKGHWAQSFIEDMASKQIVKGKTIDTFAPEDTITRAEFVTMVVRALALKGDGKSKIANIDKDKWYANYMLLAKDAGLIEGQTYNAEGIISRVEMAKIVAKAHAILNGTTVKFDGKIKFTDISSDSEDAKYIGYATENNLINGFPGDLFMPVENTTRAQAMKVIHKLVNK